MGTDTTTRPVTELTREELAQERQRLAYEASIGTPGAAKRLESVEKAIGALGRDAERTALAAKEAAHRAELEAAQRERVHRQELEAALEAALKAREPLVAKSEAAMTHLLAVLTELDAVSRSAYRISSDLGPPRARLIIGERLAVWIQHRLSGTIDGVPGAPRELRGSLASLLGVEGPKP